MKLIGYLMNIIGLNMATEIFGRLELRVSDQYQYDQPELLMCAKTFEHRPREEVCRVKPNFGFSLTSGIGMLAVSPITKTSRQVDLAFSFVWPGDLSIITWINERPVFYSGPVQNQPDWQNISFRSYNEQFYGVLIQARIKCEPNRFGPDCNTYCENSDNDVAGHYKCQAYSGDKICLNGWQTASNDTTPCNKPLCAKNCNAKNGFCTRPGECNCHEGYAGEYCDDCERKPGCVNGYCSGEPYSCKCHPNYTGPNCERPRNICAFSTRQLCLNNGHCVTTSKMQNGRYYKCDCPPGFSGQDCEIQKTKCENGGTISNDKISCLCPQGTTGLNCENHAALPDISGGKDIILGIVIGISSILIAIALIITGLVCCMRQRQLQFKPEQAHAETPDLEQDSFLASRPRTPRTGLSEKTTPTSKIVKNTTSEVRQNLHRSLAGSSGYATSYSTELTYATSTSSSTANTEPPSYDDVIDSRKCSIVIAKL